MADSSGLLYEYPVSELVVRGDGRGVGHSEVPTRNSLHGEGTLGGAVGTILRRRSAGYGHVSVACHPLALPATKSERGAATRTTVGWDGHRVHGQQSARSGGGELARIAAVGELAKVPYSACASSWVVERVFDAVTVFLLAAVALGQVDSGRT